MTARTTPPTPEELASHDAAEGAWRIETPRGTVWYVWGEIAASVAARSEPGWTWKPVTGHNFPCAWPVVGGAS